MAFYKSWKNSNSIHRYCNDRRMTIKSLICIFQFRELLKSTKGVHTAYLDNYVTVFAPSNDAMDLFKGQKDENFILHHMGKTETKLKFLYMDEF